jgi:hypothetical protein
MSHWRIMLDWSVWHRKYLERITFTTFLFLFSIYFFDIWNSRSYPFKIFNANKLYAKQENMNLLLTILDNVTKVCEKRNTLFIIANKYYTIAIFLEVSILCVVQSS